ncbi:MAG TPA: GrlR family regulatory protein [Allosphingosinicella sp.]|nr:GrlR family regulatory protein [Allosphingosinicella sp.]
MKNGLYSVQFGVGGRIGSGVVTYRDGQATGGDAGFAYAGNIAQDGDQLSGKIDIWQHTPGQDNVFAGLKSFQLDVIGHQATEDTAGLHGTTTDAPGQAVKVSMQLIRAL